MYQNIDNMIYDADSCEAAICECKRMRKADITAAIIWAAVAVSAFLLILLDAILDINIGDVVAYILLFMLIAFPGICSTIYMIKHGTFGIFFAVTKTIFRITARESSAIQLPSSSQGDIPDTQAANIINTMTPYFKEGNYGDGVKAAVKQTAVILNSSGE